MMSPLRTLAALSLAMAMAVAATAPAAAQSRRELAARLAAAETRLQQLEQRVLTGDPAAVRFQTRIDELERDLLGLNGRVEELQNENRQLRQEVNFLRRGIDMADGDGFDALEDESSVGGYRDGFDEGGRAGGPARLGAANGGDLDSSAERSLEEARAGGAAVAPSLSPSEAAGAAFGATRTVILPEEPAAALTVAKELLIDGRFEEAQEAFAQFVARFGDDPLVGEALYWEGETYSVRGDFARAANAYIESLTRFPDGERTPDAMIGLSAALAAMGQNADACNTLDAFSDQYPRADNALRRKAERARNAAGCS